ASRRAEFSPPLGSEQPSTPIDVQHLPSDEAGGLAREISTSRRDLVDLADPPHRNGLHTLAVAVTKMRVLRQIPRGVDHPRRDRVGGNAERPELDGNRLRQREYRRLA